MNHKIILELNNISFKYPDNTMAINDLSLKIENGRKIAFLGENGSGKSTLFLLLNGILKPFKGDLIFNNKKINYSKKDLIELRKKVGIVFQDPDSQIFSASVFEEISFGPMNLGLPKNEIKFRIENAMKVLNITQLKDKPTHLLSYGEKKRVSIADILAMEPEVFIFDEPTSSLDPKEKNKIIDFFNELNKNGKTLILSTHDVDFAYSWAEEIFIMKEGSIIKNGAPNEIFKDSVLLEYSGLSKPLLLELIEELNILSEFPENKIITKKEIISFIKNQAIKFKKK